jgi:hypothetical protein
MENACLSLLALSIPLSPRPSLPFPGERVAERIKTSIDAADSAKVQFYLQGV